MAISSYYIQKPQQLLIYIYCFDWLMQLLESLFFVRNEKENKLVAELIELFFFSIIASYDAFDGMKKHLRFISMPNFRCFYFVGYGLWNCWFLYTYILPKNRFSATKYGKAKENWIESYQGSKLFKYKYILFFENLKMYQVHVVLCMCNGHTAKAIENLIFGSVLYSWYYLVFS